MCNPRLTLDGVVKFDRFIVCDSPVELRKYMDMVTWCCPKDKAHIVVDQISDMRAVGTESIFDHHAFQMRMILA
jgi:hypothetical protein